jgi:hypothetical protein
LRSYPLYSGRTRSHCRGAFQYGRGAYRDRIKTIQGPPNKTRNDAGTADREDTVDMNNVGKPERVTQNRVIKLFHEELGYRFLGTWIDRANSNIEEDLLVKILNGLIIMLKI